MTRTEKELEIIKLEDYRARLGMMNIAYLDYDEQVKARAEYQIKMQDIDQKIRELRSQK